MAWVKDDLTGVKIAELLARRGVEVSDRTMQRYVAEVLGRTRGRGSTVRVADGEPGDELQIDFGRMGFVFDPTTGRDRVVHALIFTACFSRHCFVWVSHRQTTEAVPFVSEIVMEAVDLHGEHGSPPSGRAKRVAALDGTIYNIVLPADDRHRIDDTATRKRTTRSALLSEVLLRASNGMSR